MLKNPIKLRMVFMGTSEFSKKILQRLIESGYNIVSAYTQPDKKAGRNQEIKISPIKKLAEENDIRVFTPDKFDHAAVNELENQKPDIIIVAAYGKILPKEILEIPGFGCINIHPSLLPKYRGPSPIQNAILNGETETGTTIMLMNEKIDAGDILVQEKTTIGKDETAFDLSERLAEISSDLLLKTVPLWIERKLTPQKQDDSKATFCQLIERSDGKIIWTDEAESIYNRFRAFFPWPGLFTFWENTKGITRRLKLSKISFLRNNPEMKHHIGEVFCIGEEIGAQTTRGVIILEELQPEGKPNMPARDFINGYPDFIGSILK